LFRKTRFQPGMTGKKNPRKYRSLAGNRRLRGFMFLFSSVQTGFQPAAIVSQQKFNGFVNTFL
jgi:hypothetical protein